MAITKIKRRNERIDKLVQYVTNKNKTNKSLFVSCLNCSVDNVIQEMERTRNHYAKSRGTQAFHIIQSFSPDEITPELALQIAQEFAAEHLSEYQVVIGTHCDRKHIHNHIVCAPIRGRVNPLSKRLA